MRGIVKFDSSANLVVKGIILVDSITPMVEISPIEEKPRPVGKDWFVRAGSAGDGSREQPFKDPWQALDAAKPGDTIHVTEGEYFGRLKSGKWTVKTPYLTMLGGYDNDFKVRDPWKQPTRLGFMQSPSGGGYDSYVMGEEDHSGFIFDGFVLDGKDVNRLDEKGNLQERYPGKELIQLRSPNAVLRNCIFVNSAGAAILTWGDNTLIENNLILNCNYYAIDITSTPDHPFTIRNNTILFTWCADRQSGSGGDAIRSFAGTRFNLEGNIIGYCDGVAVQTPTPFKNMRITGNVFTSNRIANFCNGGNIVIEDNNVGMLKELGFVAADNNEVMDPKMAFDEKWWTDYAGREGLNFFARQYDWRKCLDLLPQNPECEAGARPLKLEVRFNRVPGG